MKKLEKLVAGILSAAMVMSTMAVTAFAEGNDPDTIMQDTGSLKITKYEDKKDSDDVALEGVTFKIYKIADITQSAESGTIKVDAKPVDALKDVLKAEDLTSIAYNDEYDTANDQVQSGT